ncbi:beta-N-acetylhexosaminidase [Neisseria leonii]|uniref:beta-N-acetylhexosaminidase n=1 Tax=Neisseria leonii TaxID=2995413 RepID=UPI0030D4B501
MNAVPRIERGPIMADVAALALSAEEKQRLSDPAVGGVILFRRNFHNREQLSALVAEIKQLRQPPLLVAVDHEGGRVQRFIEGFTRLPAMRTLGEVWAREGSEAAKQQAEAVGWVLAVELAACGVDLSFTPVLDLDWGQCAVIGNRSFHADEAVVTELALALQKGLARGGMKACGKHFPGHGFVEGDSHLTLPLDPRPLAELEAHDLRPFAALSAAGMAAVMPAHVVYPAVDDQPAGFSPVWLKEVLRGRIGFDGVIFSDDLTMEGAGGAGSIADRAQSALAAGCDIVLVCNRPDLVDELRAGFSAPDNPALAARWQAMAGMLTAESAQTVMQGSDFQTAVAVCRRLASPQDTAGGVKVGEAF